MPKKWFYNRNTKEEILAISAPKGFIEGRLPYSLWTEERKKSYAEKHSINTYVILKEKDPLRYEEVCQKNRRRKGCIGYTNGKNNTYLHPGQDVPDGYWKGITFTKTEKYINSRKKKGYNNKGEKVNG